MPPRRSATVTLAVTLASSSAVAQTVSWTEALVTGPVAQLGHSMAFDSIRNETVLLGTGSTWVWSGGPAGRWVNKAVSGPYGGRSSSRMAFDADHQSSILFGGSGANGETWGWDGVGWSLRATSGPAPRFLHAMTYDSARHVLVLFGGSTGGGETWEWNGTAWTRRGVGAPSPRHGHAMAYDSERQRTVLFGGVDGVGFNGETWEWDGSVWIPRGVTGPSGRAFHAMAYDAARRRTVLFGGQPGGDSYSGETWEWDGSAWSPLAIGNPPARREHAMVYDSARGVVVLFGGRGPSGLLGDTWEFGPLCANVPRITSQPTTQSAAPGGIVRFSIAAAGEGPLRYQWRSGEPAVPIPGATESEYATVCRADGLNSGRFECVVSNACGITVSAPAELVLCRADFTADGFVDFFDYLEFVQSFEEGC